MPIFPFIQSISFQMWIPKADFLRPEMKTNIGEYISILHLRKNIIYYSYCLGAWVVYPKSFILYISIGLWNKFQIFLCKKRMLKILWSCSVSKNIKVKILLFFYSIIKILFAPKISSYFKFFFQTAIVELECFCRLYVLHK